MDDIEVALNTDYDINLQLTTKKELKDNDVYFQQYLKNKLQFKVNSLEREFSYIGKEYDNDLVYFYLEIENIAKVTSIEVTNTLLLSHFPRQENLIKSEVGNNNKSVLLSKDKYKEKLTYE
jgi:hypothetical protein